MATEERVQHISFIPPGRSDFLQSFTGYLSEPAEGALSPVFLSHENSENRPLRSSGRQIHSADGHAGGRLCFAMLGATPVRPTPRGQRPSQDMVNSAVP